ncbi:MAG: HlyC/CorC family transporter [Mycoplasmatales bacterium]|nr:HlyC/CorC family transporter [Mycoplasmatales bacterium]
MSTEMLIFLVVFLAILILFSAFFSAAETAYSSVSKSKIETTAKNGKKGAQLIQKHYNSFGWTLATILICNNLVNISASALITLLFSKLLGANGTSTIISTFVMTPIIVIFGEITPKLLAKKYAYSYLMKIAFVMQVFNIIFFPITYPLSKIALNSKVTNSELELKSLISLAKKEGVLGRNEATLASKALDLDSTTVSKVMITKRKIVFIKHDTTVKEALIIFKEYGFSRIPVKKDSKFVGVLILKDIIFSQRNNLVSKYMTDISTVSRHITVSRALEEMRMYKAHMVLVTEKIDSARIVGLLTIEDIMEELVGEIYDEHDEDLKIREIAHFKWIALGTVPILEIEQKIDQVFDKDNDKDNLKQWIQRRINRKIRRGLEYSYKGKIKFKVISNKNKEETIIEIIKK